MELPGQGPPPGARGLCPDGGYGYAVTVYHYARTLAIAAKAAGIAASGQTRDFYDAYVKGAVISLTRLQVRVSLQSSQKRPMVLLCPFYITEGVVAVAASGKTRDIYAASVKEANHYPKQAAGARIVMKEK
jgi:hypothetical protein